MIVYNIQLMSQLLIIVLYYEMFKIDLEVILGILCIFSDSSPFLCLGH